MTAVPPSSTFPLDPHHHDIEPVEPLKKTDDKKKTEEKPKFVKSDWYSIMQKVIADNTPAGGLPEGYPKVNCRFLKEGDLDVPRDINGKEIDINTLSVDERLALSKTRSEKYLAGSNTEGGTKFVKFPVYWEIDLGNGVVYTSDVEKSELIHKKFREYKNDVRTAPPTFVQMKDFVKKKNETFIYTSSELPNKYEKHEEVLDARRKGMQAAKQFANALKVALGDGNYDLDTKNQFVQWFATRNFINLGLFDSKGNPTHWLSSSEEGGEARRYHSVHHMKISLGDGNDYLLAPSKKSALKVEAKVGRSQFSTTVGITKDRKVLATAYRDLPEAERNAIEFAHFSRLLERALMDNADAQKLNEDIKALSILQNLLEEYATDKSQMDPQVFHEVMRSYPNSENFRFEKMNDAVADDKKVTPAQITAKEPFALMRYKKWLQKNLDERENALKGISETLQNQLLTMRLPSDSAEDDKLVKTFSDRMSGNWLQEYKAYVEYRANDALAEYHTLEAAMEGLFMSPDNINYLYGREVNTSYVEKIMPQKVGFWRHIGLALDKGFSEVGIFLPGTSIPIVGTAPIPFTYGGFRWLGNKAANILPANVRARIGNHVAPDLVALKKTFSNEVAPIVAGDNPLGGNDQINQKLNFYEAYERMKVLEQELFKWKSIAEAISDLKAPNPGTMDKVGEMWGSLTGAITSSGDRNYQYHRMLVTNANVLKTVTPSKSAIQTQLREEKRFRDANPPVFVKKPHVKTPEEPKETKKADNKAKGKDSTPPKTS